MGRTVLISLALALVVACCNASYGKYLCCLHNKLLLAGLHHPLLFFPVLNKHLLSLEDDGSAAFAVTAHRSGFYHFPDKPRLSPACSASDRSSRCRILYEESYTSPEGMQSFIALALLDGSVGVMKFHYDGAELNQVAAHILATPVQQIVPLEVMRYEGQLMIIVLHNQLLRFCPITLNTSDISQSSMRHCISLHSFVHAPAYSAISNFAHYPETSQVLFIAEGVLFGIRFDRRDLHSYVDLGDHTCDRVVYAGDHDVFVYCRSGQAIQYNTDTESMSTYQAHSGIPIPCLPPHGFYRVIQREDAITVRHSNGPEFSIAGWRNFISAKCSPAGNLYVHDRLRGITVIDIASRLICPVDGSSNTVWFGVLEEESLVIQTTNPAKIILHNESLQRIVERSGEGEAVGVILNLTIFQVSTTGSGPISFSPTSSTSNDQSPPKFDAGIGTGIGFAVLVVVILIPIILVLAFVAYRTMSK